MIKNNDKVKKYGEVLTPMKLVNEMLDTLSDDCFELGKKILDPCVGINGIFPIEFFKRVVKKNINKYKYDYICDIFWNNMMYMCDIQEDIFEKLEENINLFIKEGEKNLEKMYQMDPNDYI